MPVLVATCVLTQHVGPYTKLEWFFVDFFNLCLLLFNCILNAQAILRNFVALTVQLINPVLNLPWVSPSSSRQNIAELLQLLRVRLFVFDVSRVEQLFVVFNLLSLELFDRLINFNFLLVVNCFLLNSLLQYSHKRFQIVNSVNQAREQCYLF